MPLQKEPLEEGVSFQEVRVDPLHIKTELISKEANGSSVENDINYCSVGLVPAPTQQETPIVPKKVLEFQTSGSRTLSDLPMEEHLGVVDPLAIKTELIFKEDVDEEPQPSAIDVAPRSLIKAEPLDVLPEGAVEQHQKFHWLGSDEAEDCKPVREHSEAAHISEHSSTQPPHGDWGLCLKSDLPPPSPTWINQLEPGRPDTEGRGSTTPGSCGESEILGLPCDREEGFGCSSCQMQFRRKSELKKHVSAHVIAEKYRCEVCHKQFNKPANLEKHSRIHTGEKPFQCKLCDKRYTLSSSLMVHSKTHASVKPFRCKVCNKQFTYSFSLTVHSKTHTGEKPFECKVCSKRFTMAYSLTVHCRTHTGEKPFQCHVCHKQFIVSSNLNAHIRTHTGEKPFECNVCSKRFTEASSLTTHSRSHTGEKPFLCTLCNKRFTTSSSLTTHGRRHTGDKPFECKVCGKRFTESCSLTKHGRVHTGEKRFQCKVCNKQFTEAFNLNRHGRVHQ